MASTWWARTFLKGPTSPALANLAAFGLDNRLAGLAQASGLNYSRYADDLALSSPEPLGRDQVARMVEFVTRVAGEEGFRVNPAKTFVRRSGQRQRLACIVVNARPNVERREYEVLKATVHNEVLKATVHNAVRYGPASQNRVDHPRYQAHLLGRVSRVAQLNPARGRRLLTAFAQIDWSDK